MCKREMTLGEEIIGLSTRGIDTPTVERMYRKYIEMTADKESKEVMRAYCINDELAIKEFVNALFGTPAKSDLSWMDWENLQQQCTRLRTIRSCSFSMIM